MVLVIRIPDFVNEDGESIEFDSYMIPDSDLEDGQLRLLDVDNRVVVPVDTHIRFVVTGADVIHDFAVPALGLKIRLYSRTTKPNICIHPTRRSILRTMFRTMWSIPRFHAYCCRSCIIRKILNMVRFTIIIFK